VNTRYQYNVTYKNKNEDITQNYVHFAVQFIVFTKKVTVKIY